MFLGQGHRLYKVMQAKPFASTFSFFNVEISGFIRSKFAGFVLALISAIETIRSMSNSDGLATFLY